MAPLGMLVFGALKHFVDQAGLDRRSKRARHRTGLA